MDETPTYEMLKQRVRELEKEAEKHIRAEQALRESEEKYRTLFEKSRDAILILENRKFVDCNQATVEMLGYPDKARFLSTHPSELSPKHQPDGRDSFSKAQEMMALAVKNGSHRFEWNHLKAGGIVFPVEVILTTISSDRDNEVIHTTWRDISEHKKAEDELRHSEERFRSLVETTSDWIWEVDRDNRYSYVSPKIADILGYAPHEILGKTPFDLMPEFERERVRAAFLEIARNSAPFQGMENINLHRNGSRVVLETSGVPFFDEHNRHAGYRGIDRDITKRKQFEEQLLLTESVFTNTIEGIAITDRDGTIQKVNNAFTEITGYSSDEAVGENPRILKSDRHDEAFYGRMWKDLLEKGQWSGEIWNRRKDGIAYPEWLSISSIRNESGEISSFISVFHDISEKKFNEEKLEFLAFHDPLTRLPNRRLFYDRLKVSISSAERAENRLALLYMDIDNFKDINDSCGHPFGDELLCKVKERIAAVCRQSDTFARYGGDEFVIVLNNISHGNEAVDFAGRLLELLRDPLEVMGEEVFTSMSIGVAIYPDNGKDMVTLEKNADMALYRAKKDGKRRVFLFKQALQEKMLRKTFLETELRRAVKDFSSFHLVYQPKVDIRKNRIHGVEALLRWQPGGEFVSPAEFIPAAEEINAIVPLGKWVMRRAMADIKAVHDAGHGDISLSINLSTRQFNDEGLFDAIEKTVADTGFDRSRLCFEITESTPMENIERAVGIMERFRASGIQLSMDDFGTGYSSLNYLKRFPLRELKVDRSFIKDIPHDQNDVAITRTIIRMAEGLNYQVVAEGVETPAQLSFLRDNGCRLVQGFLLYKPMPIEALVSAIEDSRCRPG